MSNKEPRTLWFSVSFFWVYVVGALLFVALVGVILVRAVNAIKPEVSVHPTATAPSEPFVAQRYREIVATDNSALKHDIAQMSTTCGDLTTSKAACEANLTLVHTWLIQFGADLTSAQVPACYYVVNGQIRDNLSAYLQAEQLLYKGVTLDRAAQVAKGLSAFQRITGQMDAAVVTELSINC